MARSGSQGQSSGHVRKDLVGERPGSIIAGGFADDLEQRSRQRPQPRQPDLRGGAKRRPEVLSCAAAIAPAAGRGPRQSARVRGLHAQNGEPDFPDPQFLPSGRAFEKITGDVNPSSPTFQAAQQKCSKCSNNGGGGFIPPPREAAQAVAGRVSLGNRPDLGGSLGHIPQVAISPRR